MTSCFSKALLSHAGMPRQLHSLFIQAISIVVVEDSCNFNEENGSKCNVGDQDVKIDAKTFHSDHLWGNRNGHRGDFSYGGSNNDCAHIEGNFASWVHQSQQKECYNHGHHPYAHPSCLTTNDSPFRKCNIANHI